MTTRNLLLFVSNGVVFFGFKELDNDFYLSFFQDDHFVISNKPMVGNLVEVKMHKNVYNTVTDEGSVKLLKAYAKTGEWLYFKEKEGYFFTATE